MLNAEPFEPVTLYFPLRGGGYGRVRLAWVPNGQLIQYLQDKAVREFHLLTARKHCRVRDQRARSLRLGSAVEPGSVIVMQRVGST